MRVTLVLVAAMLLLLSLAGCSASSVQSAPPRTVPVVAVKTATVVRKTVPVEVRVIGNAEPYSTISVKAQIGGTLTRVHFREGDSVRQGDLLFLIDPRPYEEAIRQWEANLARDQALLKQAEANLTRDIAQEKFYRAESERYTRLFEDGVFSKERADQARADADARTSSVHAGHAAIESARAAVQADAAALANAKLQLSYCSIRSPVDGRTGNLSVKQGNLVKANDVELVTINQIHPIYVTFAVPEAQLPAIKKQMTAGRLVVLASPAGDFGPPVQGVLTFIDNAVDTTTGTIKLKGTFSNRDDRLWPGRFVNVVLRLTTRPNALVVPAQAIQKGQTGSFVYAIKPDQTVELRTVVPGARLDQEVVVEQGLEAGETVVTEGQLKLAPGMKVQAKP